MAKPTGTAAPPVAVPLAMGGIDIKRWHSAVQSQGLTEIAVITEVYRPDVAPETFYQAASKADIVLLLHPGGVDESATRILRALAERQDIKNPAVLTIHTGPRDADPVFEHPKTGLVVALGAVRTQLQDMVAGLQTRAFTPLREFAPLLRDAIMDAGKRPNPSTQSGVGGSGSPDAKQETPDPQGQAATGTPDTRTPTEQEDEEPASDFRFDAIRREDFSPLAWQMIEVARRLGEGRKRARASIQRLITAMVLAGLRRGADDRTGTWLVSLVSRERELVRAGILERYPAAARHKGSFDAILRSSLPVSDDMTETLHTVFGTATLLAREARPGSALVVGARHLLGAAVRQDARGTFARRALSSFGLDPDDVRRLLIEQLAVWHLDDDQDAWRRVLEPTTVDVERRLPTYAADSAVGPDLIGITREVEAMASLVSAWSVEPPLSIGLFGEWGSGKSFFMQKMKERVRQIALEARKSGRAQRDFGYYKNIVQVEFNAWHYVEGNLWASLVEQIFTNLRFEGTEKENLDSEANITARLEKLLALLPDRAADAKAKDGDAQRLSVEADQAKGKADDADKRAVKAEVAADEADRASIQAEENAKELHAQAQDTSELRRSLLAKDVVEEIWLAPEVRAELEQGLDRLGITKERLKTVQGVREALKEATDTGTVLAQGFTEVRKNGGGLILFWAVAVPATVLVLGVAFDWLGSFSGTGWVQRIGTLASMMAGVATGLVGSWRKLKPHLAPIVDLVAKLKAKRVEIEGRVEVERQKRAAEAAQLEQDVIQKQTEAQQERQKAANKAAEALQARQEAEAKRAEAEKAAQDAAAARALAEATAREAEALRPERRIATFIQDRAAATDYRRHLGVPALIRRDFEKLAAMFRTQREAEKAGQDCGAKNQQNDPTVVNRIILYIDDLDRCPPDKVVDVLRAIHLLLAFDLFVVVVAVDARWMKRSLKDRFALMLTADTRAATGAGQGRADKAPQENIAWRATATPDDYLEKIFQVPFWIRPLDRSGSRRLVVELTRHDIDTVSAFDGAPKAGAGTGAAGASPASDANADGAGAAQSADPSASPTVDKTKEAQPGAASLAKALYEWSPVEERPRALMLAPEEREYMVALSPVIGRSPRSVKRFVNCYRLLKSTLDPQDLERAKRSGTFRTSMLLLGIVTGFPEAAPALLADLRDAPRGQAPGAWARAAAKRLKLEDRGKWAELLPVISRLPEWQVRTIAPLVEGALLVDRFSFSPVQRPVEELV